MKLEGMFTLIYKKEKSSFILPSDKKVNILVVQSPDDPEMLEALTASTDRLVDGKAKNKKEMINRLAEMYLPDLKYD